MCLYGLGNQASERATSRAGARGSRGQSITETAVLLLSICVALLVFFSFIRASVSHRLKGGADTFGHGLLYDGN